MNNLSFKEKRISVVRTEDRLRDLPTWLYIMRYDMVNGHTGCKVGVTRSLRRRLESFHMDKDNHRANMRIFASIKAPDRTRALALEKFVCGKFPVKIKGREFLAYDPAVVFNFCVSHMHKFDMEAKDIFLSGSAEAEIAFTTMQGRKSSYTT